jgi:LmbE family N-acetylglucosaminyl deacetylase
VVGNVFHHIADLPDGFGSGQTSSSTVPPTPEGIAAAKGVIQSYIDAYPNSFHFTMSESDKHPDHAACGYALRELKNSAQYGPSLANAKFFVSRLYWAISQPNGQYPPEVLDAADGTLAWFPSGARYGEYCDWLRNQVIRPYKAWNPAAGAYAMGYHQVASQFNNNFGPSASIANLWHA